MKSLSTIRGSTEANNCLAEAKRAIRSEMRAIRRGKTAAERERVSRRICEWLLADERICAKLCPCGPVRGTVAVYLASPEEIDLSPFIREIVKRGVRVVAPRWSGATYELAPLAGLEPEHLREGPMKILEPLGPSPADRQETPDVWIVPGLAFSKDGGRLGYGGGWYDRLMKDASPDSMKIGVCYEFQVLNSLPFEPHDIPLSRIVSANTRVLSARENLF